MYVTCYRGKLIGAAEKTLYSSYEIRIEDLPGLLPDKSIRTTKLADLVYRWCYLRNLVLRFKNAISRRNKERKCSNVIAVLRYKEGTVRLRIMGLRFTQLYVVRENGRDVTLKSVFALCLRW